MEQYQQRAFNEGYEAYCKGLSNDKNPYEPSHINCQEFEMFAQWNSGWKEAERDNAE